MHSTMQCKQIWRMVKRNIHGGSIHIIQSKQNVASLVGWCPSSPFALLHYCLFGGGAAGGWAAKGTPHHRLSFPFVPGFCSWWIASGGSSCCLPACVCLWLKSMQRWIKLQQKITMHARGRNFAEIPEPALEDGLWCEQIANMDCSRPISRALQSFLYNELNSLTVSPATYNGFNGNCLCRVFGSLENSSDIRTTSAYSPESWDEELPHCVWRSHTIRAMFIIITAKLTYLQSWSTIAKNQRERDSASCLVTLY